MANHAHSYCTISYVPHLLKDGIPVSVVDRNINTPLPDLLSNILLYQRPQYNQSRQLSTSSFTKIGPNSNNARFRNPSGGYGNIRRRRTF